MGETDTEALLRSLSGRRVDPADGKALRYVGRFFNRRRLGRRIVADLEGNQGTYTVSFDASGTEPAAGCSCYIGAGGCHHVRALAQTFLDAPESFVPRETRTREQIRTLDDLALYLESASLEKLLADLQARGLSRQRVGQLLGTSRRALSEAAEDEISNRSPETPGPLKLACLYLVEWAEAAARGDDLARALAGRSRLDLVALAGEMVEQLGPVARRQFLDRLGPGAEPPIEPATPDGTQFLAEIDAFALDCEKGRYYDEEEVGAYQEDPEGAYEPEIEALDTLDNFLGEADRYHEAGEHAVAVAAYEKLFDILWGDTEEWFGFDEISGWLKTDLGQTTSHYLASLGRVCAPREYVQRAWERVTETDPDLLVTESSPDQLAALEAFLLGELDGASEDADYMPLALTLLRRLYDHQGRTEEELELCRRWRHRYPALLVPLMDHAEVGRDWPGLEALVREALSLPEERLRRVWPRGPAVPELERRLGRALEQRGDLEGALVHAQSAFRAQPEFEAYERIRDLATRISGERRARAVEEIVTLLRGKAVLKQPSGYYPSWADASATLLARILLAEGRHGEAHDLAMAATGATAVELLGMVGAFYLGSDRKGQPKAVEGVEAAEALTRAGECHSRLVQIHIEGRTRDSYAVAAGHAATLRDIHARQDRRADFDRWYAGLMEEYRRFRALREEFRKRLGPETRS